MSSRKPTSGPWICQTKEIMRVSGSRQRRGVGEPAWRHFRSLGSERQAVLGSSLEPVISQQRRVTWMPGIPEPLGCSALGRPPSASSLHTQPCPLHLALPRPLLLWEERVGTKADWSVQVGGGGGPLFLTVKGHPPAPSTACSASPRPAGFLHPENSLLDWQAHGFILVAGDGQGLRTSNPC